MNGESLLLAKCSAVNLINSSEQQCAFIGSHPECGDEEGFFNYASLFYCVIGGRNKALAIIWTLFCLSILFTALGVAANDFLGNSLLAISKSLNLSQNVAGVTFLAFGNGAPDIFSSLAGIRQARPELVVGQLYGGGIFVTTVVTGFILFIKQFKLKEVSILRDMLIYMFASFLTWFICWKKIISLGHAIAFLAIYLVYILIIIVGQLVTNKMKASRIYSISVIESDTTCSSETMPEVIESSSEVRDFLFKICPIDTWEWSETSLLLKCYHICKAPIQFVLIVTCPSVDHEKHKSNWCRILNCIHCITGPMVILFFTGCFFSDVGFGIPLVALIALLGLFAAICVYLTSCYERPPKYQYIFSFLGFAVSVVWIYSLSNEVVDLLKAVGILFDLSDVILGLTVLAWGNSIGDFVSNVTMARKGYPQMAVSACFGGPLLNLLLGIGLPYTLVLAGNGEPLSLSYTKMISLLYVTITFSLFASAFIFCLTRFEGKRFHGVFLVCLYLLYLTLSILIELDLL